VENERNNNYPEPYQLRSNIAATRKKYVGQHYRARTHTFLSIHDPTDAVRPESQLCLFLYMVLAGAIVVTAREVAMFTHYHLKSTRLISEWRRLYWRTDLRARYPTDEGAAIRDHVGNPWNCKIEQRLPVESGVCASIRGVDATYRRWFSITSQSSSQNPES
jgi:hypothetical protein